MEISKHETLFQVKKYSNPLKPAINEKEAHIQARIGVLKSFPIQNP